MAKLVTVFGATGAQGNPIARALLASTFKVRAVTRNPASEKAQALKSLGAEVVKGDLNDTASVAAAVKGAYGVFYVTNYWELFGTEPSTAYDKEIKQGKSVADACKQAGTQHVIFSGLEIVKDIIGVSCPHFDTKGIIEKYLDEIGVPNTSVRYPYYFDNFAGFFQYEKQDDGSYVLTLPMDGPMDGMTVADGGPVVAAFFNNPQEFIGKKIGLSSQKLTLDEYTAIVSKVTGKTIKYNYVPPAVYAKFPFPMADDLAAMFDFYARGNPQRSIEITRRYNPNVQSFEEWATQNKDKLLKD